MNAKELDEFSHVELVNELVRRTDSNAVGRCAYCRRRFEEEECGQPEQHRRSETLAVLHRALN